MRTLACWMVAAAVLSAQAGRVDPERILAERLQFTAKEVAQARQGQPVVKVKIEGDELAAVGALRLPGKKERLADWMKNVEHFRRSAELGVAQPVPVPPAAAAFAGVTLDAKDLDSLKECTAQKCDMRVSTGAIAELQRGGMANANDVFRRMLFGELTDYLKNGNGGAVGPLARKAATLTAISPQLVTFLERYPSASLPGSDQLFYWASAPVGSVSILSLHHFVIYRPRPDEVWIADKTIYASRYFDTGVLVAGLYDAADGNGFYAVAGSRAVSGYLGGAAGGILRRQLQRSAADSVKTYLEWIRDSLSAAGL
jgi:hypothetical protein